jgi:hypothetical protein
LIISSKNYILYTLDISENEYRDAAVLLLYKGFRQKIIKFSRCLFNELWLGLDICDNQS